MLGWFHPFIFSFFMRLFLIGFILLFHQVAFAMAPKINWDQAIDSAIVRYGLRMEPELKRYFEKAHTAYPPRDVALLAFKKEKKVELWAKNGSEHWHYIHTYPLTATSGRLGPKLREHDGQIPEGIYHLTSFNPFSSMHLSMMIDYPNDFDKYHAYQEGRKKLGNNIFLHGKSVSVGCLAIGDKAIDQLFLLARRVGLSHIQLIIAPNDLRRGKAATPSFAQPKWLPELYHRIGNALKKFPKTRTA